MEFTRNPRNADQISLTAPPSLLRLAIFFKHPHSTYLRGACLRGYNFLSVVVVAEAPVTAWPQPNT